MLNLGIGFGIASKNVSFELTGEDMTEMAEDRVNRELA